MFPETCWTIVATATLNGDASGKRALDELCRAYWPAVVAYLKSRSIKHEVAEDIAQEFFTALVESKMWHRADQARGKFRSFLLGALRRVVSDYLRREQAEKRGGGVALLSYDEIYEVAAEEPAQDRHFDRAWASRVLEQAVMQLEKESADKAELALLLRYLPLGDDAPVYEQGAAELGCSAMALKLRVHRFRKKFRQQVERVIACTVSEPRLIQEELRYLEEVLADPEFV